MQCNSFIPYMFTEPSIHRPGDIATIETDQLILTEDRFWREGTNNEAKCPSGSDHFQEEQIRQGRELLGVWRDKDLCVLTEKRQGEGLGGVRRKGVSSFFSLHARIMLDVMHAALTRFD